jgi:TolB-like protein/class 3 adenylate cyclase/Tfp pilus assembly protein PilF
MATTTATRRLAAILAADVVGYSRLMGADEEGTHERFKAHLREVVDPKIREHHGRIVKTTGDGILAEFASVVDAVRCAAEIQRAMTDRDSHLSEERRLRFRIGVNLGDVIADDADIYGEGVNIAARLEGLAAPGGIFVSGTVRDHIGDRLPYAFEDIGEQSVKNIARPVRVYALRPERAAVLPPSRSPARLFGRSRAIVGLVVATGLAVVCIVWWFLPATFRSQTGKPTEHTSVASAPTAQAAGSISQPTVAPRLSIVVLPFANLSNDPDQQYFADGITEDLTTALSRVADMLVISRNTAFTYRNKSIDTRQIGRDLSVRYVLEGSVRRSDNKIRVNAQLIDAQTDTHLWAEQFDGDKSDLFALQKEITGRIANTLNLELVTAEAARPTENPDALDYILHGRAIRAKPNSPKVIAQAIDLFERALSLDPQSVEAQSLLANALVVRVLDGMTASGAKDLARADELVNQALAAAPRYAFARATKGDILRARMRYEEAIPQYEMALSLNSNMAFVLHALGACKLMIGAIEEVIPIEEKAIRLSPRDPNIANRYFRIGVVHLLQSRTDEAIAWLEKARVANPEIAWVRAALASAYGLKGETQRAAAELAEARKLVGNDRYSSIARLEAEYFGVPKIRALYEATYFVGLRNAGIPEE